MPRNQTATFDGLVVGYGTHTADNNVSAVVAGVGGRVVMRQLITGVDLIDTYAIAESRHGLSLRNWKQMYLHLVQVALLVAKPQVTQTSLTRQIIAS